jgi:hypothetical protein
MGNLYLIIITGMDFYVQVIISIPGYIVVLETATRDIIYWK